MMAMKSHVLDISNFCMTLPLRVRLQAGQLIMIIFLPLREGCAGLFWPAVPLDSVFFCVDGCTGLIIFCLR